MLVFSPTPCQQLYHAVRHIVTERSICAGAIGICQWMWKCLGRTPDIVNIMCRGTRKAWAQCMWAKLGGFAIITSATTKGNFVSGSGSTQDSQHPSSISSIIWRFRPVSPPAMVDIFGMIPGFFTMNYVADIRPDTLSLARA